MIYFDNAATCGYRPQSVINAVMNTIKYMSANPGRSGHALSLACGKLVLDCREKLASFFNAEKLEQVIFTKNCTEALNMGIFGSLRENGHVIATANEHNSVLRPLFELERAKIIKLSIVYPNGEGKITAKAVEEKLRPNTYLVCVCHASNVTGAESEIEQIGKLTREKNILLLTDAAQSAGHLPIDIKHMNIDMLALAGHKGMLSIQGSGALIFNDRVKLKPTMYGGTGTASESVYQPIAAPEAFESGTLATPAIAGLSAGTDYIKDNFGKNSEALRAVQTYLYNAILKIPHVQIRSYKNHCGIISVEVEDLTSSDVCNIMNEKYNVALRGGLHCAPLIHEHLHTLTNGLTRISASPFTTKTDCDALINGLRNIYN